MLRYFNPFGADSKINIGEDPVKEGGNLGPALVKSISNNKKGFTIYGDDYDTRDGTCIRDFIHISDLANGHLKALTFIENTKGYHVWNLGTGRGYTVKEVVEKFQSISGAKLNIKYSEKKAG